VSGFLERLPQLLAGDGYLLPAIAGAMLLILVAASFGLRRSVRKGSIKRNLATSVEDEEKIDRIVRKLHHTMRQAGEQGLDEETIFDRALYEQMKADEKGLDRLLPSILIKLYNLGKFTLTMTDRMDLVQFVRFFNEKTGANVRL
jgi:hypothetical protein